jgi:glycosyltransferase involved in cell wall biosynthesis
MEAGGPDQALVRRFRIAHFTTIDASLFFLLRTELEEALAAGHDVIGLSAPGPCVDGLERLGVRHVPVDSLTRAWRPGSDLRAAWELSRAIKNLRPDVLHTHTPKAGVLGRIVGRWCRVPIIVNTCHGLPVTVDDRWSKRLAVKAIEGFAAQFSDVELFLNGEDFTSMARFVKRRQPTVVGNGTDLERFRFDEQGRVRIRAELGLRPHDVLVGAVGRRVAEKGMYEFAEAARRLASQAHFVWVGPQDPDKPDAVGHDLEGVRFLGERLDMPDVYSALDVFVLPSYREGFPRSAMEAAACGRPMVLTDIRGSREIGSDGVEAVFVPARRADELAGAIEALIADEARRNRLGEAARERAAVHFDQREMARRSFAAYEGVARRKALAARPDPSPTNSPAHG